MAFNNTDKKKRNLKSCWYLVEDDNAAPVPNLSGDVVEKVIEYCKKHEHGEHEAREDESLKKWDAEFVKVDHDTLIELILAAHYLNIPSLRDLTSRTVEDMMKTNTNHA